MLRISNHNNERAREVCVPLDMLTPDKQYTAYIYHDSDDADWQTNPYGCVKEQAEVTNADTLHLKMASGGGFAIQIIIH